MFFKNGIVYINKRLEKINFSVVNKKIQIRKIPEKDEVVIDLSNLIVSPGFVDVHIHTRVPGFEIKDDLDHITKSLINGGFTHALAQANVFPEPTNLKIWKSINNIIQKSDVNIFQSARITKDGKTIDIEKISKVNKFFSDDGDPVEDTSEMRKALILAKKTDSTLFLHEEDKTIKGVMYGCDLSKKWNLKSFNDEYESNIVERDLNLNKEINAKLHFQHISTYKSIRLIEKAYKNNMDVSLEITPHHLYFSNKDIINDGMFKMNPPLPSPKSQKEIIKTFKKGIVIIATDHAPHEEKSKQGGFNNSVNGIIGLESAFSSVWTKAREYKINLKTVLEAMTNRPAKLLGIKEYGIKNGVVANLTIIDPLEEWIFKKENIYSKSKNSPFIGEKFTGRVKQIILNGKHIIL